MDASQVIFIFSGLLILVSALMVVTTRNLIHAALWLISTLLGVAVLFVLLDASFLAVVQVVVYIGAIAIMFIFAVMLTRKELRDKGAQVNAGWPVAALLAPSFPAGFDASGRWRAGLQLIGRPRGDAALLECSATVLAVDEAGLRRVDVAVRQRQPLAALALVASERGRRTLLVEIEAEAVVGAGQ